MIFYKSFGEFHKICNFGAAGDRYELIKLWGRKVKGQGHDETKHESTVRHTKTLLIGLLPERDYVTFESLLSQIHLSVICRLSVCLSATLVHPTQEVKAFSNISSPLYTLGIPWTPRKILRKSSQGNFYAGDVKRKRVSEIERKWTCRRLSHKRYKIRPRVQLMTNTKWYMRNSLV